MIFQEQQELESEQNAKYDRIAELTAEMVDYGDRPEPIDMEAWRANIYAIKLKASTIAPIYGDDGLEICY